VFNCVKIISRLCKFIMKSRHSILKTVGIVTLATMLNTFTANEVFGQIDSLENIKTDSLKNELLITRHKITRLEKSIDDWNNQLCVLEENNADSYDIKEYKSKLFTANILIDAFRERYDIIIETIDEK